MTAPLRVVALGGGHGLAATIAALRAMPLPRPAEISAIVTVADDGGSSGRLVRDLGVPPPGDARRCLVALAADGNDLVDVFAYRFGAGDLAGHALGNLILAALADTEGSFAGALQAAATMLGCAGRVLPAAAEAVKLVADIGGVKVSGQSVIKHVSGIRTVHLEPADPAVDPDAVAAIAAADLIVLGPGSLYTSILPVVLVPGLARALAASTAPKVFVCNLTEQKGETQGLDAAAHLAVLLEHSGPGLVDVMLVNTGEVAVGTALDVPVPDVLAGVTLHKAPVSADTGAVHDPQRLAAAFADLAQR